jgi:hypothetical protein
LETGSSFPGASNIVNIYSQGSFDFQAFGKIKEKRMRKEVVKRFYKRRHEELK